jgi:hypothetical protein
VLHHPPTPFFSDFIDAKIVISFHIFLPTGKLSSVLKIKVFAKFFLASIISVRSTYL